MSFGEIATKVYAIRDQEGAFWTGRALNKESIRKSYGGWTQNVINAKVYRGRPAAVKVAGEIKAGVEWSKKISSRDTLPKVQFPLELVEVHYSVGDAEEV